MRGFHFGAFAQQRSEHFVWIDRRCGVFERTREARRFRADQCRIVHHRRQHLPRAREVVFGAQQFDVGALQFDLSGQHVGAVGLAYVIKVFRNRDRSAREFDELFAQVSQLLRAQRFIKQHPHGVRHAPALRLGVARRFVFGLRINVLAFRQLAAEQDFLLEKEAVAAAQRTYAPVESEAFAFIANRRIRPQSGLAALPFCRANRGLGLRHRRVVAQRQRFELRQL